MAALGFPNGAESGVWRRNWSNMELLRVLVYVSVILILVHPTMGAVNNVHLVTPRLRLGNQEICLSDFEMLSCR